MWTYLVGSYDTVAAELARYVARCRQTFILDVPFDREELDHVNIAFARAMLMSRHDLPAAGPRRAAGRQAARGARHRGW
jgi:hypothetical protein